MSTMCVLGDVDFASRGYSTARRRRYRPADQKATTMLHIRARLTTLAVFAIEMALARV